MFLVDENSMEDIPRMDARFAETLVRKWQNVKSQALGPDHYVSKLPEVRERPFYNSVISPYFVLKSKENLIISYVEYAFLFVFIRKDFKSTTYH